MLINYIVPFERCVVVPDHWVVPFMDGQCRILEEGGCAKALLIEFSNQSVEYSPRMELSSGDAASYTITSRDIKMPFVIARLRDAMAFVQCYFNVGLSLDEVEAKYIGENLEEEELIKVKAMSMSRAAPSTPVTFDFFTRAFMAAEEGRGPRFDASLLASARRALSEGQYIDSFRYAFLLIEARYGQGQFKTASLKTALKTNPVFQDILLGALGDVADFKFSRRSDSFDLLTGKPSLEDVINHLVEKRGFYFHSNNQRKDSWRPEEQGEAEILAKFATCVAMGIAVRSAAPLFSKSFREDMLTMLVQWELLLCTK